MLKILALLLMLTPLLMACETVKGVGRDVTNAGEALEDAIEGE